MSLTQSKGEEPSSGFVSDRPDSGSGHENVTKELWEVFDFFGTRVLCEESSKGSLTASVIVNDTFSIPDSQYISWCIDESDGDEKPLGIYVASFLIPAVGILSNIIVCLILARKQRLKKNFSNFHIFHLALIDLFLRCIFVSIVMDISGSYIRSNWSCKLLCFIDFSTLAITFTLLSGVAINRYLNICHPFKARLLTWKHSGMVIMISWLFSMVFSMPLTISRRFGDPWEQITDYYQNFTTWTSEEEKDKYRECHFARGFYLELFSTLYFLFAFIVPLLAIIICYSLVVKRLWKRSQNRITNGIIARSKLKVVKMLVVVVLVYIFSWGPFLVIHLLRSYNIGMYKIDYALQITSEEEEKKLESIINWLDDIAHIASCLSSVANPLVFIFYSRNFRSELQNIMCCMSGVFIARHGNRESRAQSSFKLTLKHNRFRSNQIYIFEKNRQFSKGHETKHKYTFRSEFNPSNRY